VATDGGADGPVGVVGAGTMGAGIAEAAARAGLETRLHDPIPEALTRARERIDGSLARSVERGRMSAEEADGTRARLSLVGDLEGLGGCTVVIEAAPEDRSLKEGVFRRLDAACPPPAVLATNTSSLPVTGVAAATAHPGRVVGMHFFNPAPVMRLVEVVAGARSSPEAVATAEELARRMGKTAVLVSDTPGFVVNRVNRPYYGEALRMLGEGIGGVELIDSALRGAGFPMGPFELLDLIGVEVNLAVTRSVWEAMFYDPRYKPHPIQVRLAEGGMFGRKSGRGFYGYGPENRRLGPTEGLGPAPGEERAPALPWGDEEAKAVQAALDLPRPLEAGIVTRLVAMLVNEAVAAADDAVATPEGIDDAMRLGVNHPRGPFETLELLGAATVLSVMDGLWSWYREERYRAAPGLRRRAAAG
jgi:3-hydroxybutyryl-CoA dehydrogenase